MLYMPLMWPNHQHNFLFQHNTFYKWQPEGDKPIRYFVEPIALVVNYAPALGYEEVGVMGLSGVVGHPLYMLQSTLVLQYHYLLRVAWHGIFLGITRSATASSACKKTATGSSPRHRPPRYISWLPWKQADI